MLIRRLRLVNFRQHADTVLEFETGLTGIIGPGRGSKSSWISTWARIAIGSFAP